MECAREGEGKVLPPSWAHSKLPSIFASKRGRNYFIGIAMFMLFIMASGLVMSMGWPISVGVTPGGIGGICIIAPFCIIGVGAAGIASSAGRTMPGSVPGIIGWASLALWACAERASTPNAAVAKRG